MERKGSKGERGKRECELTNVTISCFFVGLCVRGKGREERREREGERKEERENRSKNT